MINIFDLSWLNEGDAANLFLFFVGTLFSLAFNIVLTFVLKVRIGHEYIVLPILFFIILELIYWSTDASDYFSKKVKSLFWKVVELKFIFGIIAFFYLSVLYFIILLIKRLGKFLLENIGVVHDMIIFLLGNIVSIIFVFLGIFFLIVLFVAYIKINALKYKDKYEQINNKKIRRKKKK